MVSSTEPARTRRIQFDSELIRKYDVNGPRYTSYPTANLFTDDFDPERYAAALKRLPSAPPLSVYVHVPFCATICYYCACNKIVTNNRRHAAAYIPRVFDEMTAVAALLPPDHEVEQLHFGGGTPTYFSDEQFAQMFDTLRARFNLCAGADRDFSIEIDPRTVDASRIALLASLGINRMSLGIQDFDPAVQQAVNRLQSEADTASVIRAARANGVKSLSVDLIYGLPVQTPAGFARTLNRVIGLEPDRISLYSYAHLPGRFKTQRQINERDLPDAATKLQLMQLATELLDDAGYVYVGMDHFARPDDTLVKARKDNTLHRNFQGYTTHGHCDLIGLGVSAISSVAGVYAQNAKTLDAYYELVDRKRLPIERGLSLSNDDLLVRNLIGRLMCYFELDSKALRAAESAGFGPRIARAIQALRPLQRDGLVTMTADGIKATPKGRFLIRNVCMTFDDYLEQQPAGFSRAI
jgi:oxygen-independent coproporphyrinogen-3 oxidase